MLFSLKLAATPRRLGDDIDVDIDIRNFGRESASKIELLAIDLENMILDHYVGREKLQLKTKVDQAIVNITSDINSITTELNPPLIAKQIESKTGAFHLGIFIGGISAMPLVNIIVHEHGKDSKTNETVVAPRVFGWAYNQFHVLQKDPEEKKSYIYSELRAQISQFLAELKTAIPSLEKYLKELNDNLSALYVSIGIER